VLSETDFEALATPQNPKPKTSDSAPVKLSNAQKAKLFQTKEVLAS
jgi:hypothetical protein